MATPDFIEFAEFAMRLHNDFYYCHPKYGELHNQASEIVELYMKWKETRSNKESTKMRAVITDWLETYESVPFKTKKEEVEINDTCAICCETPEKGSLVRKCPNGHVFHESCVVNLTVHKKEDHYSKTVTCPTCRCDMDFEYSKEIKAK